MKQNVIAIFGRPNVGKSTLFNRLTKTKDAIVDSMPGVTRDRHYGMVNIHNQNCILIDTGGFTQSSLDVLQQELNVQVDLALEQADVILWVVDAQTGKIPEEQEFAQKLRKSKAAVIVCANKAEGLEEAVALDDFYTIGFENLCAISCAHNHGIENLKDIISSFLSCNESDVSNIDDSSIKVAIIGRPNVGKSTFTNALLKDNRMIVSEVSGTTRDSIHSDFSYKQDKFTIIDTAGIRKKSKIVKKQTESFSVIKSLKSVEQAHVVIVMCDAADGITDQDCQLINFVIESGRGLIIAMNKADIIDENNQYELNYSIDKRLSFVNFTQLVFCIAQQKKGIGKIMQLVKKTYLNGQKKFSTAVLTQWLIKAQEAHQPPMINSRRIKLRFAHMSNGFPPYIVIHGKQIDSLPTHYKRYLENSLRKTFDLQGIPVRITFTQDNNPYINQD